MTLQNNQLVTDVKSLKDKGHTEDFQWMEIYQWISTNTVKELRRIVEDVETVKKGGEENKQSRYNALVAARDLYRDSKKQMALHSVDYIKLSDEYWQVCKYNNNI